jgi:hypothetical protein
MRSKNKKTKNNISKPAYDEDTVKESLIKLASETPEEEAEMLLDMELKQLFDEFIKTYFIKGWRTFNRCTVGHDEE